ncbi:hypothetical protein AG1IA_08108 [Rhizoctonia solani AG-1 IA]|uniref:Uncharacterized protein n=1 Tax=Thanatephorus cucumeris (strain AG1-IA) TaxID=983506 RepID=L8WM79_THACA|nr:hypothetical protein AG1IA_08108 [Rhizoctonia solani AG-1 IA]
MCINPEGHGNKWVRTTDVLLKRETLNHPNSTRGPRAYANLRFASLASCSSWMLINKLPGTSCISYIHIEYRRY